MLEDKDLKAIRAELAALRQQVHEIRALVGPFGVAFPDGTVLVQTLQHLKYFIDGSDLIMAPQLIVYRQWEPELSAYFLSALKPGQVFLDVGANFGYFTVLAASAVGGAGKVYAVEANPALCALIRKNVEINWSIAPVEVIGNAAHNEPGAMTLYVPKGRAANASLTPPPGECDSYHVEAKGLDDMLPADLRVDLMKIDVEGFEFFALQGGERVLRNSPDLRLVMEWSQAQMREAGSDPAALLNYLRELGLEPHRLPLTEPDARGWKELKLTHEDVLQIPYDNIVMRRP